MGTPDRPSVVSSKNPSGPICPWGMSFSVLSLSGMNTTVSTVTALLLPFRVTLPCTGTYVYVEHPVTGSDTAKLPATNRKVHVRHRKRVIGTPGEGISKWLPIADGVTVPGIIDGLPGGDEDRVGNGSRRTVAQTDD